MEIPDHIIERLGIDQYISGASPADADTVLQAGIRLKGYQHNQLDDMVHKMATTHPLDRTYLTLSEFKEYFCPKTEAVNSVKEYMTDAGFSFTSEDPACRMMVFSGKVETFEQEFGIKIVTKKISGTWYYGFTGDLKISAELSTWITGVFGLVTWPMGGRKVEGHKITPPTRKPFSQTVPDITRKYHFPENKGKGQKIALVELGGGFKERDIRKYFKSINMDPPEIKTVFLEGATNRTGLRYAFGQLEVTTDICVLGAAAPEATLVVYFNDALSSDISFSWTYLYTLSQIIMDEENQCKVISTSWGDIEERYNPSMMDEMNRLFQEASLLGITICTSTGDLGSQVTEAEDGSMSPNVHFPASSPFVLACGGSEPMPGLKPGMPYREKVWNEPSANIFWILSRSFATGGGISKFFPAADYQRNCKLPLNEKGFRGRGVPDVCANAGFFSGYDIWLWGIRMKGVGGTSVAAPLWAGLIARVNEAMGKPVGFINHHLYDHLGPQEVLNEIVEGNNNNNQVTDPKLFYQCTKGWNACTGWGSPHGINFLESFRKDEKGP
ncbi:MAG: S8/S53 family peptidase [Bacteroidia bacterium]|nr:S8/S53 family peptidase [Bacteroidia bacterium]